MANPVPLAAEDDIERFEFTLSEPINVFGEMTKVLKWRKPNGADIIKVGNPVIFQPFTDPVQITHDMPRMMAMLARLANMPSSSVERMAPRDLVSLTWEVTPFFMPRVSTTS
jgi:hypothetical protein